MTDAEAPPTWAIVSLMGHKTYAGRLAEEEKFGCKLGRLDIPEDKGCPRCGGSGGGPDPAIQCGMCIAGRVGGWRTVYFGGQSVHSIQVVTEAVARVAARGANPTPISPWDFPKQLAQSPLVRDEHDIEDDEPPDHKNCARCNAGMPSRRVNTLCEECYAEENDDEDDFEPDYS